ncbi:MAG: 2,3-bisphosphoglycerate-independent phosphoglycerate mutase [Candidatus Bathyarchaeia archaeon]
MFSRMVERKVILVVRDGWGYSEEVVGNAVHLADTPTNDRLLERYPWTLLKCTGNAVGLPEGTQGGSEPGHLTIGAGRVVLQPYEKINRSIEDGSFYENEALLGAISHCRERSTKLHLMGLLSDQGIHGTTEHLYALLELCRRNNFDRTYIHCFLDGRDVPEKSAKRFLRETKKKISEKGLGGIATMIGRYYAMDRDNNWNRTQVAYDLLTLGKGEEARGALEGIEEAYSRDVKSDYYVGPIVIVIEGHSPVATVDDSDAIIFWNFRSDRARQITYAFHGDVPEGFNTREDLNVHFVCMSEYDKDLELPVAFPQQKVENNLGKILSERGLNQLRIAETEKYAHVTFFFNSQVEEPEPGEERILVPSSKVPSYEEKPEMSAPEINQRLIQEIRSGRYDFILVNYANGDLVGHSANLKAGIRAVEAVDKCVGEVVNTGLEMSYTIMVTGDHGNVETMLYPNGEPNPSHGTNPVPFILVSDEPELKRVELEKGKGLSSVAPTILELMSIPKPKEMTGDALVEV